MARSVGPGGTLDVLSLAILEDLKDDKPNQQKKQNKQRELPSQNRYYSAAFFRDLAPDAEPLNDKLYDQKKQFIGCACATAISAIAFGILNLLPFFIPLLGITLNISLLEATVIMASTYAIAFCMSPVACVLINCMGSRLTCIFGQILLFGGIVLDAFELGVFTFYIAHLGLIGIGSGFTITAASSAVLRHFRKKLFYALIILTTALPLGSVFFYGLYYCLVILADFSYRWFMISVAIIVLLTVAATHPLPKHTRNHRHPNPFRPKLTRADFNEAAQNCVNTAAAPSTDSSNSSDSYDSYDLERTGRRESCVCICILDFSACSDIPFLLWVLLSSCATMTTYVPWSFVLWHVTLTYGFPVDYCIVLVTYFSVGTLVGRVGVMMSKNHTFKFNRTIFQGGMIGSACLYAVLHLTSTYGWFRVWIVVIGVFDGLIIGSIPRLTLQTIPRRHMNHCWGYIVFCNGAATILGPYLLTTLRLSGNMVVACIAIGIVQFSAAILAMFLPNEDNST